MRILATALIVVSLAATTAVAQFTINSTPQGGAFVDPIIRVTTSFRTAVTLSSTQPVPEAAAREGARRALYAMAVDECTSLSEIFKSECWISSVQMIAPPAIGAPATPTNIMTATAVYDLRPMRAPSR